MLKAMPQRRVLIVDDALFMRNTLRDIFSSAGFTVAGEADDGVQAVNLFRELKPDLVTMDIVMPYKSGIDATREIVQLDPSADRKSTRLNSSHVAISYAVFCLK